MPGVEIVETSTRSYDEGDIILMCWAVWARSPPKSGR